MLIIDPYASAQFEGKRPRTRLGHSQFHCTSVPSQQDAPQLFVETDDDTEYTRHAPENDGSDVEDEQRSEYDSDSDGDDHEHISMATLAGDHPLLLLPSRSRSGRLVKSAVKLDL